MNVAPVSRAWSTHSAEETERLGTVLARFLEPGDVIALRGPLGAGKTRFVAGIARGLGSMEPVKSPTFTLLHEYRCHPPLLHADLYRLEPAEVVDLGLDEATERAVLVAEWGERLPSEYLARSLGIRFDIVSEYERRLSASASPGRALDLLEEWGREARAERSGSVRPR